MNNLRPIPEHFVTRLAGSALARRRTRALNPVAPRVAEA